jgi:hypothetical protein
LAKIFFTIITSVPYTLGYFLHIRYIFLKNLEAPHFWGLFFPRLFDVMKQSGLARSSYELILTNKWLDYIFSPTHLVTLLERQSSL